MVFSSLTFLFCFLPLMLLLYYICKDIRWKNVILLLASLVFYAWGEPVYVVLMTLSIIFNYFAGLDIENNRKKGVLAFAVVINLLILGYFKYSGFVIDTINDIFKTTIRNRELPLPIGISFYTFQAMSYLIDIYRNDGKAQKNILSFGVYITMFPQLIAGPIVRYKDIDEQLNNRKFAGKDFSDGCLVFIKGLFKKVVLANCIGAVHTEIMAMGTDSISALTAWIGALAYTMQIFNDFSGYSDMAIGLGKMLGFNFPKNFDRPYSSKSVTEFWRRWHISLGTWFREYLYIPLGGNRCSAFRQIINLLIVWMATGLWHGAAWNFVFWGVYYGVLLIFEKFVYKKIQAKLPAFINAITTFFAVIIGWVFFFNNSLKEAFSYIGAMFGRNGVGADRTAIFLLASNIVMLVLAWIPSVMKDSSERKNHLPNPVKWILSIALFVISIAFLVSESYNPFLYFRF